MAIIEINLRPSEKELRWFGLLMWLFLALVGAVIYWRTGSLAIATTLTVVGGGLCCFYYALRPLRRPLYVGWMVAVYPLGWLISHLLFAAIYFLVVTPIGAFLRLFGYDPMGRGDSTEEPSSYWVERRQPSDLSRYFRQF